MYYYKRICTAGGGRISKIYGFQWVLNADPYGKNVSPLPGKNPVYALDY